MSREHEEKAEETRQGIREDAQADTVRGRAEPLRDRRGREPETDGELVDPDRTKPLAQRRLGVEAEVAPALDDRGEPRLGRYVLLKELGRGGQGQVFLARDAGLGREVALKVLNGAGAISPAARLRFKGEAEKAARLEHPNIARVHEWGEDGGVPYIAMEFVRGETLAS